MKKSNLRVDDLPLPDNQQIQFLSTQLAKKIDSALWKNKYAPVGDVLKLIGAGVFVASTLVIPTLPQVVKPYLADGTSAESWKRFNISYLKRTIARLEREKLIRIARKNGRHELQVTDKGSRKILSYALDELSISKPRIWDKMWRMISYDVPKNHATTRDIFREYIRAWKFYPLHESVFLHAYPCEQEVDFLRQYLGISQFVRIFTVIRIENDKEFRSFFGV